MLDPLSESSGQHRGKNMGLSDIIKPGEPI
jgi:hypothetical protein